ncbi:MAG: hypothetical protein QGG64_02840 [Candidatus Latescibacteria bacterium]|jgi:hypothetical protein|nr:hypothetical protein [Candidatus Latescibacterota bacterium]
MDTESLWEKIKQGLREGAATAAEKAEYLGKLGRARLDIARTRHAIHDSFTELGAQVYEQLQNDEDALDAQTDDVKNHVQTIRGQEEQLQQQETEFKALQEAESDDDTEAS